jgi:cAMP-dependent protein kinase regulator
VASDIKKKIQKLKESGHASLAKGNWEKAKDQFLAILKLSPKDLAAMMKVADCLVKLDRIDEAVVFYDRVAIAYTRDGFLVKAIAVNKLILRYRPNTPGIHDRLSLLYSERIGEQGPKIPVARERKGEEEPFPRSVLFSDLAHSEFMAVVDKMTPIEIPKDTLIIQEGDRGDSIYIIASGEVKIFRDDEDGNEIWITNLGEGDFFGEFGYFSESKRIASVKSLSDVTLLELTREDVASITKEHPGVKDVLLKFYKERVLDTLLAISPIFSPLAPEKRKVLLESFDPGSFKKGVVIIREGDAGDKMYFIRSGEVEVTTQKDDDTVTLAKLRPGDFFGEVSLITGKPRTATVGALTDVNLFEISKGKIEGVVKEHPEILDTLNEYIAKRVEDTISTIMQYKNRKSESGLL